MWVTYAVLQQWVNGLRLVRDGKLHSRYHRTPGVRRTWKRAEINKSVLILISLIASNDPSDWLTIWVTWEQVSFEAGQQRLGVDQRQFAQTLGYHVPGSLLLTLAVFEQQWPNRLHVGLQPGDGCRACKQTNNVKTKHTHTHTHTGNVMCFSSLMISLSEWSSRYCLLEEEISCRTKGRYSGRFPTAMLPNAYEAADFTCDTESRWLNLHRNNSTGEQPQESSLLPLNTSRQRLASFPSSLFSQ